MHIYEHSPQEASEQVKQIPYWPRTRMNLYHKQTLFCKCSLDHSIPIKQGLTGNQGIYAYDHK